MTRQPHTRYRIGLALAATGTLDVNSRHRGIQGDEQVALSWKKYLERCDEVDCVSLLGSDYDQSAGLDIVIHFDPFIAPHPRAVNILYMQNAFPRPQYPDGTQGVFRAVREKFRGFIFTSAKLMECCAPGAVIPFATDPEALSPRFDARFSHPVSFLGNPIRGPHVEHRYIAPAIPFGLAIYSKTPWPDPFAGSWKGSLPGADMPGLYTSSLINLNAHLDEHLEMETVNLRIFDVLACEGFVISDNMECMEEIFEGAIVLTSGYEDEWAKISYYLSHREERIERQKRGRQIVLRDHTYKARMETLLRFLREI